MIKNYRKKPVVIQAVQFTGENYEEIEAWCGGNVFHVGNEILIVTLEGTMTAPPGWWIIRGVVGEFYPCDPEVFAQTYEEMNDGLPRTD